MSYLRKPVAFLIRDVREEASYKLAFIMRTAGVFLATFTFFFLSKLIGKATVPYLTAYGGDYFSFVLIGIAFSGYHQVALSGFSRRIREAQMKGTLEAVLLTQTGIPDAVGCALFRRWDRHFGREDQQRQRARRLSHSAPHNHVVLRHWDYVSQLRDGV